jgi:phosphoribosylanthranilate isomerase
MTDVKICGISTPEAMTAAIDGGARFVGLVFYPKSPRAVSLEVAAYLASYVPHDVRIVGLFVDPTDELLRTTLDTVRLDMLQLHGTESPGRVAEIKTAFGVPVMKAISVASADDLQMVPGYEAAADWLLFDARAPADAAIPGGNGLPFDWTILKDFSASRPWMLAGGLTSENVSAALAVLEPDALDVSSGVESAPGIKDPAKIRAFLAAVQASN